MRCRWEDADVFPRGSLLPGLHGGLREQLPEPQSQVPFGLPKSVQDQVCRIDHHDPEFHRHFLRALSQLQQAQ